MTVIEATYRIVTPMFCAGADQQRAELRLPSFKGALRFWWRSLMWGQVKDHRELREKEAALFGASESAVGQSKVKLRIVDVQLGRTLRPRKRIIKDGGSGLAYLGYGVINYNGKLQRPAIDGGSFTVECRFSRKATDEQVEQVGRAISLLGTVGGIGSRSRKGFGSLTLVALKQNGRLVDLETAPDTAIGKALGELPEGEPSWTAWSKESRVLCFSVKGLRPTRLLDRYGGLMSDFRFWHGAGRSQFRNDHDMLYDYLTTGQEPPRPPERIAFGLPHNYFFKSLSDRRAKRFVKAEVTPEKKPQGTELTRRASPLFFHVHQTENENPVGVVAFLPSLFLPEPARVTIADTSSGKGLNRRRYRPVVSDLPQKPLWQPIERFLDHLEEQLDAQELSLG